MGHCMVLSTSWYELHGFLSGIAVANDSRHCSVGTAKIPLFPPIGNSKLQKIQVRDVETPLTGINANSTNNGLSPHAYVDDIN